MRLFAVLNFRSKHLVGAIDLQIAQQVRIDRMLRMAAVRVGLLVQSLDTLLPHQRGHMLAADLMAFSLEHVAQHAAAGKRIVEVQFVDPAHQRQVRFAGFLRSVGRRLTRQRQDLALPSNRQVVRTVNHFFALSKPALVSAPLPFGNLVRVHVEVLRQFRQRSLALERSQCHLGLEFR